MSSIIRIKGIFCLILSISLFIACDDDDNGKPQADAAILSAADLTVEETEANQTLQVRFTLSKAVDANVVLRVSTKDGLAAAVSDYEGFSDKILTFQPNQLELLLPVVIRGDGKEENEEYFDIIIVNVSNAAAAKNSVRITIKDNDNTGVPGELHVPATGFDAPESYAGYTKKWSDEFDGATLNTANWTQESGNNNGWGNQELQYYQGQNTYMHDGKYLVIEAKKENVGGFNYTSSRMISHNKKFFKYGRIDIRAALPEGQGIWPALWMLGSNFSTKGWPACGEIDIMEYLGHEKERVHGTAHWGPNSGQRQMKTGSTLSGPEGDFHAAFHVFSIVWEENKITWLLDDKPYHTLTSAESNGFEYPFNADFFFIMNIAVGGQWPGNPDESTVFPQFMIVDYVRVYQKD